MQTLTMLMVAATLLVSTPTVANERQQVLGFGGVFFKAENPALLAKWYEDHLGVKQTPRSYDELPWQQQGGSTVFGIFKNTTGYFGDAEQQWMLNFRVADLDAIVAQLRADGISVDVDAETYPNGRFARLQDPEGNPIQLWQEQAPD